MPDDLLGSGGVSALANQGSNVSGILHVFVAFDWGEQIKFDQVEKRFPGSRHDLTRRRRTPSSFTYRPAPVHLPLESANLELSEIGNIQVAAGLTLFDFGAVSLALRIPFDLFAEHLLSLAGSLADPSALLKTAKKMLEPIYQQLLPSLVEPCWQSELNEDYFVFQLAPCHLDLIKNAPWLAGLVHLESAPLSTSEIAEALRLQLSYSPADIFIADWGAAVLIDQDCDETLQTIEFANLQLLEFRHIDNRLDERLEIASRMIDPLTRSALPFWRVHAGPLRALGELKVEANALFERTENSLKLVGDPFLARIYRLVAARFHLDTWEENIQRKLEVAEGVYQVVSDQASHFRAEFLEIVVVLLILIEIILAFIH